MLAYNHGSKFTSASGCSKCIPLANYTFWAVKEESHMIFFSLEFRCQFELQGDTSYKVLQCIQAAFLLQTGAGYIERLGLTMFFAASTLPKREGKLDVCSTFDLRLSQRMPTLSTSKEKPLWSPARALGWINQHNCLVHSDNLDCTVVIKSSEGDAWFPGKGFSKCIFTKIGNPLEIHLLVVSANSTRQMIPTK